MPAPGTATCGGAWSWRALAALWCGLERRACRQVDGVIAACSLCVDPRDPPAIAAAIDYLASHPDIARRMGENGRKAVCARYNWPREASKLIQFYEHL